MKRTENSANRKKQEAMEVEANRRIRLFGSLAVALIASLLFLSTSFGDNDNTTIDRSLAQSLAPGQNAGALESDAIVSRTIEQHFNIQLVESSYPGEIPYSDVWVLNDPFMPLMGDVGALVDNEGTLDSKLGLILNRDLDEGTAGSSTAPTTTPSSTVPVTAEVSSGQVILVQDIFESRGIKYAKIKVGDTSYENIKAGVSFGNNYKIVEFKSSTVLVLMCGDETYELQKGQLRRI